MEINDNLCIIPFIHMGTKPDGVARVCCMAPALEIANKTEQLMFPKNKIEEAWNSPYMRELRKKMLSGQQLKECGACWKQELAGPHSKRLRENKKYLEENKSRIFEANQNDGCVSQPPIYFDLRLGNLCNLRCRTCNPMFSNAWEKELQENTLVSFVDSTAEDIGATLARAEKMQAWYQGTFIDNLVEIIPSLQEIYVSGGEPMMVPELERFLEKCIEMGAANRIEIRMNSNMTVLNDSFISKLALFKKVSIGASLDAYEEKNDWLRFPSRWSHVSCNLEKLLLFSSKHKNFEVTINITVSIYNVLYLEPLLFWLKVKMKTSFTFDFVTYPDYMSLEFLPQSLVKEAIARLNLIKDLTLTSHETMYVAQLIKKVQCQPRADAKRLIQKFLNHTSVVDGWRNQDAKKVFPELFSYFDEKIISGGVYPEV